MRLLSPLFLLALAGCSTALVDEATASPDTLETSDAIAQDGTGPARAIDYVVEPGRSHLEVLVYKDPDTIAAGASHDHVITAQGWTGFITWSQGDNASCKVKFDVPVSSLSPDQPARRKVHGLTSVLSDGQRGDVKKNMLGGDQLAAGKHAKITFNAKSCSAAQGTVQVKGALTIRGVTKPVTIPMKVTATDAEFAAKGQVTIKATDFGFQPYTAGFGALKNKNQMKLVIDVHARPK